MDNEIMENQFSNLGLKPEIVEAVTQMGFSEPTEVQSRAIPIILDNRDVIVRSKTGSGKTGAFSLPILNKLEADEIALILTPTRELALQIDQDITKFKKGLNLKTTVVYGQHNIAKEIEALPGAQIITGTPGRVWDHVQQHNIELKKVKYLVLDEADRMLDMGFFDQVIRIVKKTPEERMTLLFSATMPPEITSMAKRYMKAPEIIEIQSETLTVDTIQQSYFRVQRDEKNTVLNRILKYHQPDSCMVFCNTRMAVDRVDVFLKRRGYHSDALHGANTQSNRTRTLQRFKKGDIQILVATDVAARGLHVEDLSLVVNYDVPNEKDNYIHRIGRTGRAGNGGIAISLVTSDDIRSLYEIEEHVGVLIDEAEAPTEEMAEAAYTQSESKWKSKKRFEFVERKEDDTKARPKRSREGDRYDDKRKNRTEDGDRKPSGDRPKRAKEGIRESGRTSTRDAKPRHEHKPTAERMMNAKSADISATKHQNRTENRGHSKPQARPHAMPQAKPQSKPQSATHTPAVGYKVRVESTKAYVEQKQKEVNETVRIEAPKKGLFSKIAGLFKK